MRVIFLTAAALALTACTASVDVGPAEQMTEIVSLGHIPGGQMYLITDIETGCEYIYIDSVEAVALVPRNDANGQICNSG